MSTDTLKESPSTFDSSKSQKRDAVNLEEPGMFMGHGKYLIQAFLFG